MSRTPPPLQWLRQRLVRPQFAQPTDLSGRQMLVTGATPGSIGFETARILGSWGAAVTISTRNHTEAALQALRARQPGARFDGHPLDLSDAASVRRYADWFLQAHEAQLDVLVNNAGVHLDLLSQWKQPKLSADGHEIQWRTNYLGTMQLTHRLLPALQASGRRSGDARIVNVVSQLHARGSNEALFAPLDPYDSWVAYGTSKLALVHATRELQRRYAADHVQAYCLHPGAVFTGIAAKGLAGNPLLERARNSLAFVEAFFLMTPEEGAQTQVHCATRTALPGGLYYERCTPTLAAAAADDIGAAERLWDQTQSWIASLG